MDLGIRFQQQHECLLPACLRTTCCVARPPITTLSKASRHAAVAGALDQMYQDLGPPIAWITRFDAAALQGFFDNLRRSAVEQRSRIKH